MSDRLLREIRQRRPFASLEQEAFLNLQRSAGELGQRQARFFKRYGLTPTQYNALRILRGAHPRTLACREVGRRMVTPVPDVTRLLDRLAAKGLVERGRNDTDRRVVEARITAAGRLLLDDIDAPLEAWLKTALGHLGDGRLADLVDLLEEVRGGVDSL